MFCFRNAEQRLTGQTVFLITVVPFKKGFSSLTLNPEMGKDARLKLLRIINYIISKNVNKIYALSKNGTQNIPEMSLGTFSKSTHLHLKSAF